MRILAPLLLLLAALLAAVGVDATPADADLTIINRSDFFTLDPQRMSYLKDFQLAYALYEGLVRWDNEDDSIVPAAARALPEISEDQRAYTFRLRPDATWSNGEPVTAEDFIFAWQRALLPDTAADYSNLFFVIEGAEAFYHWRAEQLARFASGDQVEAPLEERRRSALDLWERTQRRFRETVGLEALDEQTLRITLARPVAFFLDLLCFPVFYPVYRPAVEGWPETGVTGASHPPPLDQCRWVRLDAGTGRLEQKHQWARSGALIGNGPYLLERWRYRRDLLLEKNPRYHDAARVRARSVHVLVIEDTNTAVLAFESGRADWLTDVNAEYQPDMLQQRRAYEQRHREHLDALLAADTPIDVALGGLPAPERGERRDIHAFPTFGTDFYSFNCRPALAGGEPNPFASAAVRRAFALSVDKQIIVRQVTRMNEPVMQAFIPPGSIPGYTSPAGLPHDPDRARRELRDAGYEDRDGDGLIEDARGRPFPVVDLLYTTGSPRYKWISLQLKAQWERALGVRVELRGEDTKFFKEDLKQGKFMIARGRWYGDYGDPTTFLNLFRTDDGNNDRGYSSARVDRMLDDAEAELDPARRLALLAECERFLFQEELPLLPICQLLQVYMYEPGALRGISHHPRLVQYLWQMEAVER